MNLHLPDDEALFPPAVVGVIGAICGQPRPVDDAAAVAGQVDPAVDARITVEGLGKTPVLVSSSVMRTHLRPASSERKTPGTPPTRGGVERRVVRPDAGLPKPMMSAISTLDTRVNVAPESVGRHSPREVQEFPPAGQTSPSRPGTDHHAAVAVGSPFVARQARHANHRG